jgi:hypothetical protein
LVVLVAALGLVAARSTRLPRIVAGSAAIAAVVTALLVARPISHASAVELADRIVNPMAHQTCRSPVAQLRVCAYADYAELATRTAAAVGPVGAAVPDGVLDDVVFLTYMADGFEHLQSEVRAAIGERRTSLPEHPMRLRFNSHPDNFDAARLRLAAHAVGLPTEATRIGTVVAGQARGVVALWLATRGLDARAAGRFVRDGSVDHPDVPDATDRGAIWPGLCHDEVGVLQWAPKDLVAVRALMARPSADVARLLHDGWSRFTAPTTTTDELLVAAGLAPLGPPERVEARDYRC